MLNGGDYFKGMSGPDGGETPAMRFVPFNGGVSREQLAWLRGELADAAARGERVVVLTHNPLHPAAASWRNVAFDAPELLDALHAHARGGTVVAVRKRARAPPSLALALRVGGRMKPSRAHRLAALPPFRSSRATRTAAGTTATRRACTT